MLEQLIGLTSAAVVAALSMTSTMEAAAPIYKQAPAQLFAPREGLGNVFSRLEAGKEVRVAYFGGSITAQEGYRPKTLQWLRTTFPRARISEINAAIGGTGSDLGVYRFRQDVLSHRPDLVFIEFAVNDSGAAPEEIWRNMEGIIRQAWKASPYTDLCFVYTYVQSFSSDLDRGLCPRAASADEALADYYGIPSINMALRTAELVRTGKMIVMPQKDPEGHTVPTPPGVILFSMDGVHPLDAGHEVYTRVITDALQEMERNPRPFRHRLRHAFVRDNLEAARLAPLEPWMMTAGWKRLDSTSGLGAAFHDRLPEIWEATRPGEKISFGFRGTTVGVYDLMGPDAGKAICTLDGARQEPHSRFDIFSSYHRLASLNIGQNLPAGVHSVTIEVSPEEPDRSAVVNAEKTKPGFNPEKYHGTVLRIGSLMMVGSVVKGDH